MTPRQRSAATSRCHSPRPAAYLRLRSHGLADGGTGQGKPDGRGARVWLRSCDAGTSLVHDGDFANLNLDPSRALFDWRVPAVGDIEIS
jgi:hypothetical protein